MKKDILSIGLLGEEVRQIFDNSMSTTAPKPTDHYQYTNFICVMDQHGDKWQAIKDVLHPSFNGVFCQKYNSPVYKTIDPKELKIIEVKPFYNVDKDPEAQYNFFRGKPFTKFISDHELMKFIEGYIKEKTSNPLGVELSDLNDACKQNIIDRQEAYSMGIY